MERAITASMIWSGMSVASLRAGRQRLPAGDRPHAQPGILVVHDPSEVPSQFHHGCKLAALLVSGSDRGGVGFGDDEHQRSMGQLGGEQQAEPHRRRHRTYPRFYTVRATEKRSVRFALDMETCMGKVWPLLAALSLGACASNPLPPPNSVQSKFDPLVGAVRVMVSDLQPLSAADLLGPDGTRLPASAVTLVSGPHVDYSPPPSVGIGIGGFGFSRGGGFGSGVGVGMPLGSPTPTHVDDQYIGSAVIPVPGDYNQTWSTYRLEIQVGNRPMILAAPAPSAG
jgi:hypothetical protein